MSEQTLLPATPLLPDRKRFIDPGNAPALEAYLRNVFQWHGYIQFVSVTSVRENPDVPIARLFIEPYLASQWVSPDAPQDKWPKNALLTAALVEHPRLVVLGDPGSGKSTLVSWLAWQLARRKKTPWIPVLDGLVPIPMVLRELGIAPGITWDGLLNAFLSRDVAKPLAEHRELLPRMLACGQAYLLLDGLDEIGDLEARRSLRDAVFEVMYRFPARWILTSRIVGYEEGPFHNREIKTRVGEGDPWPPVVRGAFRVGVLPAAGLLTGRPAPGTEVTFVHTVSELAYVAPFNDEQIHRYARNWFAQRDLVSERAAAHGEDFIRALYGHETITRLARTPYILNLMALIYRVKAKLPHGRALLYQQIAEAYLQAIDEYRKLQELGYPLAQKRRWLARVAFEMQLRRAERVHRASAENETAMPGAATEILVGQEEVAHWVAEAMGESGYGRDQSAAAELVDYIARRSGLLMPRGPGQFAFAHLSFQEYFAACYLAEQLRSPIWLRKGRTPDPRVHEGLRAYARDVLWHETVIFLFELVADEPGWTEATADTFFGEGFKDLEAQRERAIPAAILLAHLAVDPHSGFNKPMRAQAMERCWGIELGAQEQSSLWEYNKPAVAQVLLGAPQEELAGVWAVFEKSGANTKLLSLRGCPVSDVAPLGKLPFLELLVLNDTQVSDLRPLAALTRLRELGLGGTAARDLTPLAKLKHLRQLHLWRTPVTDFTPLSDLSELQWLNLDTTRIQDLTPLAKLAALQLLDLDGTKVSDLTPLARLNALQGLAVGGTKVSDLTPLAKLASLKALALYETEVTDLTPLVNLSTLEVLWIHNSKVTEEHVRWFNKRRRSAGLREVNVNPVFEIP